MSQASYMAAAAFAGGGCPIEAGVLGSLADNECEHGRLPGDRTPDCGCWSSEPAMQPIQLNGMNRAHRTASRTSRYHGVWRVPRNGKWRAEVRVAGRRHPLGYFETEEAAAQAVETFKTNPTQITRRNNGNDAHPNHADRLARFAAQAHQQADHGRSNHDRAEVA